MTDDPACIEALLDSGEAMDTSRTNALEIVPQKKNNIIMQLLDDISHEFDDARFVQNIQATAQKIGASGNFKLSGAIRAVLECPDSKAHEYKFLMASERVKAASLVLSLVANTLGDIAQLIFAEAMTGKKVPIGYTVPPNAIGDWVGSQIRDFLLHLGVVTPEEMQVQEVKIDPQQPPKQGGNGKIVLE